MAGAPPPRPSSASERKKLIEEYEQAKRSEVERLTTEQAEGLRRKKTTRAVFMGTVLVVLLYLAFSPPAWLLPPQQPVPTAAEREASIRFTMYLQSQQIEQFRGSRGRLPSTLEEAGQPLPNIQYTVVSGSNYLLRSTSNNAIQFNSTDSAHAFLGESMAQLGPSQ